MSATEIVFNYLSGSLTLRDLQSKVMEDRELEEFLSQDIQIPPYTKSGSLFLYVIEQNPSNVVADVNVKDAMSKLLDCLSIDHEVDKSSSAALDLILDAAPKWVDVPDQYMSELVKILPNRAPRRERVKVIKDQIAADFVVYKKPPKWLQSPTCVFSESRPLTFFEQLDIGDLNAR